MKYLTADLHFDHYNIIKYCNRPWNNIKDMNNALIKNINSLVKPKDDLYIVGDFGFFRKSGIDKLRKFVEEINGRKHLILGNHDDFKPFAYVNMGFTSVHTSLELNDYYLVHDPATSIINKSKIWLCGHVHDFFKTQKNVVNVGVDVWDYKPISIDEITIFINDCLNNNILTLEK